MSGDYDWSTTASPKKSQLMGVESSENTVFVSGKRGVLIERTGPDEWESVFTAGATGDGRGVLDLSLTDDGERVWFSGYSGVFGYYDRENESVEPHPGPYDLTSNFRSISVNGEAGGEEVHAVDGGGRVLRVQMTDERMNVKSVSVPGDGAGFSEIVDDDGVLYAADRNGFLYRSENGRTWRKRRLAQTTIKALARTDAGLVAVDDGGTTYKHISLFDEAGRTKKTELDISSPQELEAQGETIVAVGGGGCILVIDENARATRAACGVGSTFYGAEITDDGTIVAAGSDGVIAEGTPK